ncbi:hypothetical protein PT2222_90010 [Paraburkholderia tropica]
MTAPFSAASALITVKIVVPTSGRRDGKEGVSRFCVDGACEGCGAFMARSSGIGGTGKPDCREIGAAACAGSGGGFGRAAQPAFGDEHIGRADPETEVARDALREFEHGAVLRDQPRRAARAREFEKLLVVAVAALRQRARVGGQFGRFDQRDERRQRGQRAGLVHAAPLQMRIIEHERELAAAARVDQRCERAAFERGADRPRVGIVEDEDVEPDIGVEHHDGRVGIPGRKTGHS